MAGAGRTVFEFTGSEADKEHRGSRGTFMGATLDLGPLREERESNLRSGPSGWIFAGLAVLLAGGITAYFLLGDKGKAEPEEAAAVAKTETPAAPAPETKAAGDETGGAAGDETAGGTGEPAAADAKAPVDDAKAVAPVTPTPVEPTPVAPATEPKPSGGTTKPSGGGTKHTGGTTKPKPKPEPKEDPKPSGGKSLKPKKPPRDPLGNLPPPPSG